MNKMKKTLILTFTCMLSIFSSLAFANDANDIFLKNQKILFDYNRIFSGKVNIISDNGKTEKRIIVFLQKFDGKVNKSRMYLYGKGSWTGMGIITHSKQNIDFWIRLPNATSPRKIDVNNLYEPMLGSTLWKSDAVKLSFALHHHQRKTLAKSGPIKVNGKFKKFTNTIKTKSKKWKKIFDKKFAQVNQKAKQNLFSSYEATPQGINANYAKKYVWITKKTGMVAYERFTDKSGNLIRENTALQIDICNGMPTGWMSVSKDLNAGKTSVMISNQVVYVRAQDLPDHLFEPGALMKPLEQTFLTTMMKKPGAVMCKRKR